MNKAIEILLLNQCLFFALIHGTPVQYDFYSDGHVSESDWLSESDFEEDTYKRPSVSETKIHSLLKRDILEEETEISAVSVVSADLEEPSVVNVTEPSASNSSTSSFGQSILNILSPLRFFIREELSSVTPHEIVIEHETVTDSGLTEVTTDEMTTTTTILEASTDGIRKRSANSTETPSAASLAHVKLNRDIPGGAIITDDVVEKIAEIQAEPVILTQGI